MALVCGLPPHGDTLAISGWAESGNAQVHAQTEVNTCWSWWLCWLQVALLDCRHWPSFQKWSVYMRGSEFVYVCVWESAHTCILGCMCIAEQVCAWTHVCTCVWMGRSGRELLDSAAWSRPPTQSLTRAGRSMLVSGKMLKAQSTASAGLKLEKLETLYLQLPSTSQVKEHLPYIWQSQWH